MQHFRTSVQSKACHKTFVFFNTRILGSAGTSHFNLTVIESLQHLRDIHTYANFDQNKIYYVVQSYETIHY